MGMGPLQLVVHVVHHIHGEEQEINWNKTSKELTSLKM